MSHCYLRSSRNFSGDHGQITACQRPAIARLYHCRTLLPVPEINLKTCKSSIKNVCLEIETERILTLGMSSTQPSRGFPGAQPGPFTNTDNLLTRPSVHHAVFSMWIQWHICNAESMPSLDLAEKSSINTNRKSTTRFPMNSRWTLYVVPKPPKGGSKMQCPKFKR